MLNESPIYYDSPKGEIIKAIIQGKKYKEDKIRKYTKLSLRIFNENFDQLMREKILFEQYEDIFFVDEIVRQEYTNFNDDPHIQEENSNKLQDKIVSWIKTEYPDFNDHFYLYGEDFDFFLRKIVNKASNEIIIVSPFLNEVDLVDRLTFLDKKIKRKIVTRKPRKGSKTFYKKLEYKGIELIHPNIDFHAKIQLYDNKIAIISSYNLDKYSASKNWESGLVTINPKVVSEIRESINRLISDV